MTVLQHSDVPVLIAKGEQTQIERVVICTAAGEPGKSDVIVKANDPDTVKSHAVVFPAMGLSEVPSVVIDPSSGPAPPVRWTLYVIGVVLAIPHTHISATASNPTMFPRIGILLTNFGPSQTGATRCLRVSAGSNHLEH